MKMRTTSNVSSSVRSEGKGGRCLRSYLFMTLFVTSVLAILRNGAMLMENLQLRVVGQWDGVGTDDSSSDHDIVAEIDDSSMVEEATISDESSTGFSSLIHVIQTRFMQSQPNLTELGLARVLLFETFCLPTILRQSSQNYVWLIRTDPMLNDAVREKLLALIRPYSQHIYLIASNGFPIAFRNEKYMDDIREDSLWNGDYQQLLRTHQQAHMRIVVDSRLDADDGLYRDFVRDLQRDAIKSLKKTSRDDDHDDNDIRSNSTQPTWKAWCADIHVDWQLVSPWNGFNPASGVLKRVDTQMCVTPGLTYGYAVDANLDFSRKEHNHLHLKFPACRKNSNSGKRGASMSNCLARFRAKKTSAVRARTVTSAGMLDVVLASRKEKLTNKKLGLLKKRQRNLWAVMVNQFGITRDKVSKTRDILKSKQTTIASENMKGQCIKGFTCKENTRLKLQVVAEEGME